MILKSYIYQSNILSQSSRQYINKIGTTANQESIVSKTIHLGAPSISNTIFVSPPPLNKSGEDLNDARLGFGGCKVTGTIPISVALNSLYALEKLEKYQTKLVSKDGKVKRTINLQWNKKGVKRFTAYMLWSSEIRKKLVEHHPNIDFATISKKLGKLWATVPNLEKHSWKKRAKRLQIRTANQNKKLSQSIPSGMVTHQEDSMPKVINLLSFEPEVTGTQPIDIAAHLALLGESLTLIGKRLTEYKGQMVISGILPLLLDSLLCALGFLLCLTQQIPETNGAESQVLSSILEDIAYIMPGL